MIGGPSSQAMIVHFPPCWNLIYSRLPHEMATSSMVCVRCAFARLLVLHASSHTSRLINMKPEETGFVWRGKAGGICPTGNRESKSTSRASKRCFGLWWACYHKLGHDSGGYEPLGLFNIIPTTPTTQQQILTHTYTQSARSHRPITRKCHLDVLFK